MEYRKSHKRRLTKFGKIFFCFTIILMIGFLSLYVNNSNRNLFGPSRRWWRTTPISVRTFSPVSGPRP